MDMYLEWADGCLEWADGKLQTTAGYLHIDGRLAVVTTLISIWLLATYIYYRRATSWRVVPAGIPWYFSHPDSKGKTPAWSAQVGAHLKDFHKGIEFVMTGYRKVRKLSSDV